MDTSVWPWKGEAIRDRQLISFRDSGCQPMSYWAKKTGLTEGSLQTRLTVGWDIEAAIRVPRHHLVNFSIQHSGRNVKANDFHNVFGIHHSIVRLAVFLAKDRERVVNAVINQQVLPSLENNLDRAAPLVTVKQTTKPSGYRLPERPIFRGNRSALKTIRLKSDMARAAERYAVKHRAKTGGTFSGLVELLLWDALGRPDAFTQPEPDNDIVVDVTNTDIYTGQFLGSRDFLVARQKTLGLEQYVKECEESVKNIQTTLSEIVSNLPPKSDIDRYLHQNTEEE